MIAIDCDPGAFRLAGLTTVLETCVLTLTGRAGLAGIRNRVVMDALPPPYSPSMSTIHHIFRRLVELGLVTSPQRSNQQGRPNLHQVTPAGLAVLRSAVRLDFKQADIQSPLEL